MRLNFFWTANRMITAWVVVMLGVVGVLVVVADAAGLPSLFVLVVALLVGPGSLILALMRTLTRQVDQVVAHASGERRESTVIPAAVLTLSRPAGKALGLQTAGLNAYGGSPAAVVVVPDRVELWSGKDEAEPRWSVSRDELLIGVGQVRAGMATCWDHVELSDGRHRVALSPRYSPVPSEAGKDIDRVLRELGQDPVGVRRPDLAERKDSSKIWRRLVKPFYLSMAGAGATAHVPRLRQALVRASVKVTLDQVRWLLGQGWRENAVGAWFALAVPSEEVRNAVVRAMAESQNDDAALPLAAVSVLIVGPDAVPAMEIYLERAIDLPRRPGDSFEVVAAAIAHLGGSPPGPPPEWAVDAFVELLAIARDLQQAFQTARG